MDAETLWLDFVVDALVPRLSPNTITMDFDSLEAAQEIGREVSAFHSDTHFVTVTSDSPRFFVTMKRLRS